MFAEESPDWNLDLDGSAICELCGEEAATMHLLKVEDGAVSHTHLCPRCAEGVAGETDGLALVLSVPSVLRRLGKKPAEDETVSSLLHETDERFCGVCGTTLADLKESGMVGCSNCYLIFTEHLQESLENGVRPVEHLGKMPRLGQEGDNLRHEIMRLERMLRELVECERFEEAAGVRDRLSELGRKLEGGAAS